MLPQEFVQLHTEPSDEGVEGDAHSSVPIVASRAVQPHCPPATQLGLARQTILESQVEQSQTGTTAPPVTLIQVSWSVLLKNSSGRSLAPHCALGPVGVGVAVGVESAGDGVAVAVAPPGVNVLVAVAVGTAAVGVPVAVMVTVAVAVPVGIPVGVAVPVAPGVPST